MTNLGEWMKIVKHVIELTTKKIYRLYKIFY